MPRKESDVTKRAPAPSATPKRDRRAPARQQPLERVSDEQIRLRAYLLYLQRNAAPGDPVADWLRAEHELVAETASHKRA